MIPHGRISNGKGGALLQLGLINSAFAGTHIDTAAGIRIAKDLGFDTIDIFADPLEITPLERRLVRDTCQAVDLPVVSTVCCALGIGEFNASVRRFHVDRAKRYLDLAYELHGRNLLLVLGEYIWNQEVISPEDQWKWAVEGVQALAIHAEGLKLEIAVEIEPFALSLVNTVSRMVDFLNDVGHPAALANIDISHLVLANDGPDQILRLAGRIGHVHLSDCDGKRHGDLPPGRGCVPFQPYLQALHAAGYGGTVSIELEFCPRPEGVVEWVSEAYDATSRILAELGLRSTVSRGAV